MSGRNKKVKWEKVECECFGTTRDSERDRERERERRGYDERDRRGRRERRQYNRYERRDRRYSEHGDTISPRSQVLDTCSYQDVVRGYKKQEKIVVPPRDECITSTTQARSYSEVVKGVNLSVVLRFTGRDSLTVMKR